MALYKGFLPLCLRDTPGWAAYFYTNEFLKESMGVGDTSGDDWSSKSLLKRMWCGGVAGQVSWIVSYPLDVIKADAMVATGRNLTIREAAIMGFKREGMRYFFKGLTPTLYRTFIVNLITLPAFDYMKQHYLPQKD